jgi:hypothetical protein
MGAYFGIVFVVGSAEIFDIFEAPDDYHIDGSM